MATATKLERKSLDRLILDSERELVEKDVGE